MSNERSLSDKMRATNVADLIRLADEFDAATAGFYGPTKTVEAKQFIGAWARARKAWCAHSGEPLL